MSGRFVRASKFRHVYGQPVKKELSYDNVRLTKNAWDSNLIKVNPKYLSVNWDASGGGAFAVVPLHEMGKLPDQVPLFRGHTAAVLDTDWNPFDDEIVASGSDDGKIGIWKVPQGFSMKKVLAEDEEIQDISPQKMLAGHAKKVGHVQWHPTAKNILASSSGDYTIKIWDVETEKCLFTLKHDDLITSFAFNYNGSRIASTSRNKKLRVWDIREEKTVTEGQGHTGAKSSRVVWLGNTDRFVTTGFSRLSDRQFALWDCNDVTKGPINGFQFLDASAGICMPFYDEGTQCLYMGGKGDGNIRYFEFSPEKDEFFALSEYQSVEPQRGLAFMPKRALDIKEHEVVRFYKTVNDTLVEPIQFFVPRRADTFQSDIYPLARAGEPSLTGEEWASGKNAAPKVLDLEAVFNGRETTAQVDEREPEKERRAEIIAEEKKDQQKKIEEQKAVREEKERKIQQGGSSNDSAESSKRGTPKSEEMFESKDVQAFLTKSADQDEIESVDENDEWTEVKQEAKRTSSQTSSKTPSQEPEKKPSTGSEPSSKQVNVDLDTKESELNGASDEQSAQGGTLAPEPSRSDVDDQDSPVKQFQVDNVEDTIVRLTQYVASLTVKVDKLSEQMASKNQVIAELQGQVRKLTEKLSE